MSIVSKPISLVFRRPNTVGCLACTQAELISPSFMPAPRANKNNNWLNNSACGAPVVAHVDRAEPVDRLVQPLAELDRRLPAELLAWPA